MIPIMLVLILSLDCFAVLQSSLRGQSNSTENGSGFAETTGDLTEGDFKGFSALFGFLSSPVPAVIFGKFLQWADKVSAHDPTLEHPFGLSYAFAQVPVAVLGTLLALPFTLNTTHYTMNEAVLNGVKSMGATSVTVVIGSIMSLMFVLSDDDVRGRCWSRTCMRRRVRAAQ